MRVTTSSFHCPSYCFCKPPPQPPLPPSQPPLPPPPQTPELPPVLPLSQCQAHALETEDSHHTSCRSHSGSPLEEERLCDERVEKDENGLDGGRKDILLKSSLKKTASSASKEIVKECVKWTDDLGKELVEVREFEPMIVGGWSEARMMESEDTMEPELRLPKRGVLKEKELQKSHS
ncbi:hypothetical protein KSP39_PZI000499 [Platanthera zijinensis]|uniref:Uncharacterized protein n=1 Tax=Platanthera zijinensis TaxID=2320716 RepID=A0AAP0C5P5_9ASPA